MRGNAGGRRVPACLSDQGLVSAGACSCLGAKQPAKLAASGKHLIAAIGRRPPSGRGRPVPVVALRLRTRRSPAKPKVLVVRPKPYRRVRDDPPVTTFQHAGVLTTMRVVPCTARAETEPVQTTTWFIRRQSRLRQRVRHRPGCALGAWRDTSLGRRVPAPAPANRPQR